tara:strand:+ start:1034 stop:1465 length:432 start_codon:yes stop_codon:yes gene_type:complete
MTTLIWLHEDALRLDHPVFNDIAENYVAFFIWDNIYYKEMDYGFNRLSFIYEVMSDLPFDIYEGRIQDVILEMLDHFNADRILIPQTPNRVIKNYLSALKVPIEVGYVADEAFVPMVGQTVEKRFFRFWNKIKKNAFLLDYDD